jgi:hypothetical protein
LRLDVVLLSVINTAQKCTAWSRMQKSGKSALSASLSTAELCWFVCVASIKCPTVSWCKGADRAISSAGVAAATGRAIPTKSMGGGGILASSTVGAAALAILICVVGRCWRLVSRAWCCRRCRPGRTRKTSTT